MHFYFKGLSVFYLWLSDDFLTFSGLKTNFHSEIMLAVKNHRLVESQNSVFSLSSFSPPSLPFYPSPPPPFLSPPPPSILTAPCFFSPLSLSLHFWGLNSLEVSKPQLFKSHPNAEGENTREESRPESSFSNSKI